MAELFRMPEIMADAAEATLESWQVTESRPYSTGDTLATVETDKAVVDVAAESDGVILKALVAEGSRVKTGAPLALIGAPDERIEDVAATLAALGWSASDDTASPDPAESSGVQASQLAEAALARPAPEAVQSSEPAGRIHASPLVRRLAREASIPLQELTGTGPGGRIVRRDVEAAIAGRATALAGDTRAQPRAPTGRPAPVLTPTGDGGADVPHSRIRRVIATRLTESKRSAPHFYLRGTAEVGELLKVRAALNAGGKLRISVNDLVIKAVAAAHAMVPAMNVIWTPEAVRSFASVDVAVAVATEQGLVTPVLRSVERMTVSRVADAVKDYVERARTGRLKEAELAGGTITVTNLGMYGVEEFSAIINPPHASILAVGAVREEPIVTKGRVRAGKVMRVTLSVDHRPVDGVVAAEWMRAFISVVENPLQILA